MSKASRVSILFCALAFAACGGLPGQATSSRINGSVQNEEGKFLGCHLDANNRAILATVRESRLDFVEAFTPPPDCNVAVDEALEAWPGKRLWVNFPSSVASKTWRPAPR